ASTGPADLLAAAARQRPGSAQPTGRKRCPRVVRGSSERGPDGLRPAASRPDRAVRASAPALTAHTQPDHTAEELRGQPDSTELPTGQSRVTRVVPSREAAARSLHPRGRG